MLHRKTKKLRLATILSLALASGLAPSLAHPAGPRIDSYRTHSRLSIPIDDGVPADWKSTSTGFELLLKGIGLADLGAPLGAEKQWLAHHEKVRDPRLASLKITETPAGVLISGRWKYPTGDLAPAAPAMESFEYRDKSPQFVVDFWLKKGPTVAEVRAARLRAARAADLEKSQKDAKARAARRLASEQQRRQVEEMTERFCKEPMSEKSDVFLPFLPYHEKVDFTRWLPTRTPDEQYTYAAPEGKGRDAQYARLALKLYQQGNLALAIRTLDFLEAEHPRNPYRREMQFLRANAFVKLGMGAEADAILSRLMVEAKDSEAALYAGMYVAATRLSKGSTLPSLESFLWLTNNYPKHRLNWVFHLGAAEALYSLKQTERAAKEYQWIVENAETDAEKMQGAARIGDLYLDRFQYEQALASYYQSLSHFKKEPERFPTIFLNRGEVLYQLGQWDRSAEAFGDFLKRYPSHPAGWRATFRLGEIAARKAQAGVGASEESRKWFYETVNRYPVSPGATLARLRLLPCGDHGGFDFESMERFLVTEAKEFDGGGQVFMKRYADLRGLAHVRALITLGREDQAVNLALQELKSNLSLEMRPFLTQIVGSLFRKTILRQLAEGKKYEALAFYQEKKEMLSGSVSVTELDYLLRLSQAASDLGLGTLGQQLADAYDQGVTASRGRSLASGGGTPAAADDLDEGLRQSERAFTRAKSIWMGSSVPGSASGLTEAARAELRQLLESVHSEAPVSLEREILLGMLDEFEGKPAAARAHAAKAQLLVSAAHGGSVTMARLNGWLASLEARAGDARSALALYQGLEKDLSPKKGAEADRRTASGGTKAGQQDPAPAAEAARLDALEVLGVPAAPSLETVVLTQAEILEKLGRWGDAAATYERAMKSGWGGSRAAFGYGNALLKDGRAEAAQKGLAALEKLAAGAEHKEDFWKRLASETLANRKSEQLKPRRAY